MESEVGNEEELVDKLSSVEKLLDEYEEKIHISKIKVIEPDLNITKEMLESMHWQDVQNLVWTYAQYVLGLQKEINKHNSRYNWAETNLKRFLERESPHYEGWKWEERMANALSDNVYAQKLHSLKVKSKLVIDRLAFLPSKIEFLTKIAQDVMKTKRYKNVETD